MLSVINCSISFCGTASVEFNNNTAFAGGAIFGYDASNILIDKNLRVTYKENKAFDTGRAVFNSDNSTLSCSGNSVIIFSSNNAPYEGGAISSGNNNNISFCGSTSVMFNNNVVFNLIGRGGGIRSALHSFVTFYGNSVVKFDNNRTKYGGGAINIAVTSSALVNDYATILFLNNTAMWGGAIHGYDAVIISFDRYSRVKLTGNKASNSSPILILHCCLVGSQ